MWRRALSNRQARSLSRELFPPIAKGEKIDHIIRPKSALVFFIESLCKRNLLDRVEVVQVSLGLEGTKAQMFWGSGHWLLPVFTFYAYFTWNISFCISESSHLCIGETSAPHVSRLRFYLPIWGSSHPCSLWLCVQVKTEIGRRELFFLVTKANLALLFTTKNWTRTLFWGLSLSVSLLNIPKGNILTALALAQHFTFLKKKKKKCRDGTNTAPDMKPKLLNHLLKGEHTLYAQAEGEATRNRCQTWDNHTR